jgi:hypothetical protein
MTRLRIFLFGCPVCSMPSFFQALGHGKQYHAVGCVLRDQTEASRSWAYAEDVSPSDECDCIPGQPHRQESKP